MLKKDLVKLDVALIVLLIIALIVLLFGYLEIRDRNEQIVTLQQNLSQTKTDLNAIINTQNEGLSEASTTIAALSEELNLTAEELEDVEDDYRKERDRNEEFEDQIEDLTGVVTDLDKLSKTDEELLQKYSKVSFLNEHYVPERLRGIDDEWKYDESRNHELNASVMPFFEDMVEDAKDDDINLWVVSAYRSFAYQEQLKGRYLVTYGTGANAFSADQGFSEHQLGTAVDFTTNDLGGGLDGFGNTKAYEWLQDNAHKYGFVLSYPPNNAFYVFEPWHWRFVGVDLAKDLDRDDAFFYDWDQRDIDEYLIKLFD